MWSGGVQQRDLWHFMQSEQETSFENYSGAGGIYLGAKGSNPGYKSQLATRASEIVRKK